MSKIAKFIRLALNNSSASEAATALKQAANAMQAEGVNPSDFLQEVGAQACPDLSAELAEAKGLAVFWHEKHKEQEQEIKDLSVEAVRLSALEKASFNNAVTWRNRFVWGVAATVCAVVISWAVGTLQGKEEGRELVAATRSIDAEESNVATCRVIGESTAFTFDNGTVTRYENGARAEVKDFGTNYGRDVFINEVNANTKSKVECKLGVLP
ncbi:hypothetical protein B6T80_23150 [Salmonella enterica subsp. enterica serovar Newport]|nr:hypothetical protein [Salmonella enterica subsp. enterica serovar Newport]